MQKNSHPEWLVTPYGQQRPLTPPGATACAATDIKILKIEPGKATSHHFHLLRQSWFYLLSGSVRATSHFHHWQQELQVGDLLALQAGEDHFFLNTGATVAEILEIGTPGHKADDKISLSSPVGPCPVPPGRFWSREARQQRPGLLLANLCTPESACLSQEMGVDAVGFDLSDDQWSERLASLTWIDRLKPTMSRFLYTHLTEPRLVLALLHRLRCDTLQGYRVTEKLHTLYDQVRHHGYRVVPTFTGTGMDLVAQATQIRTWPTPPDAILWQPSSIPMAWENDCAILESLQLPWMVSLEQREIPQTFQKRTHFAGIVAPASLWQRPIGDHGLWIPDQNAIIELLRSLGGTGCLTFYNPLL
ncbi:MAG: cupin domain-containing protein [Magnetococcales bacterium]|nr:cupin domain-containing protein [Magnetococcales bacterium]